MRSTRVGLTFIFDDVTVIVLGSRFPIGHCDRCERFG